MRTKEAILNALEVIREVCKENNCETCPLRYANDMNECFCEIERVTPEEWELNIVDDAWRAFKD